MLDGIESNSSPAKYITAPTPTPTGPNNALATGKLSDTLGTTVAI